MNIVGKTLVIINLVLALLVAGFLAVDFATRSNWKEGYNKLKGELDVARANTTTAQETNRKLLDEKKTAEKAKNDKDLEFKAYQVASDDKVEQARRKAQEEAKKAEAAEFNLMRLTSEKGRLESEIKDLTGLVKKRDEMVRDLQDASNKYRQEALANEQKANSANQRSLALLDQLRQKELELVKRENQGKGIGAAALSPRNPDYRNPPAAYVKGVVEKVDPKDGSVAQISLGSDEGLKENNTLDVFRLSPDPVWVGTLRLTDVNHHTSVGRLLPRTGGRGTLKAGDEVASRIIR